jgi:hypothetical protein
MHPTGVGILGEIGEGNGIGKGKQETGNLRREEEIVSQVNV